MDIGARIVQLREQKGWSTNRLANYCGISQSFLRSVELGEKGISVENLSLVCDTLGIGMRDFFDVPDPQDTLTQVLTRQLRRLTPAQQAALAEFLSTLP